jgi:hypothetical protein
VASLEPETAEAVARFAEARGRVVVVGALPYRAPGLADAEAADRRVREAMARVAAAGGVARADSPEPGGPVPADVTRGSLPDHARRSLLQWVLVQAARAGLEPDVRVAAPDPDVTFVHHRAGEREIFFLANASRQRAVDLSARFPVGDRRPWLWDPQTGGRAEVPTPRHDTLSLHLEPLESRLLVFEPEDRRSTADRAADAGTREAPPAAASLAAVSRGRDPIPLVAPWQASLQPAVGAPFERTLPQLFDLAVAGDPALATFGGTVTYRAEFDRPDDSLSVLSLGEVHGTATVRLNGRELGTRWWGRPVFDAKGVLQKGRNVLEVEVATPLGNLMRSREGDPATKRWAWWFPPIPSGLVGPVQLEKPAAP